MDEKNVEGKGKAIKKREITMDLVEIFVAILIPVVMFAPAFGVAFGVLPSLEMGTAQFLGGAVVLFFGVMCIWVMLVLRDSSYLPFSLMIIVMVSIVVLFFEGVYWLYLH